MCITVCFIYFDSLLTAMPCFWCPQPIIHLELDAVWATRPIKLYTLNRILSAPQRLSELYGCVAGSLFQFRLTVTEVWERTLHLAAAWCAEDTFNDTWPQLFSMAFESRFNMQPVKSEITMCWVELLLLAWSGIEKALAGCFYYLQSKKKWKPLDFQVNLVVTLKWQKCFC